MDTLKTTERDAKETARLDASDKRKNQELAAQRIAAIEKKNSAEANRKTDESVANTSANATVKAANTSANATVKAARIEANAKIAELWQRFFGGILTTLKQALGKLWELFVIVFGYLMRYGIPYVVLGCVIFLLVYGIPKLKSRNTTPTSSATTSGSIPSYNTPAISASGPSTIHTVMGTVKSLNPWSTPPVTTQRPDLTEGRCNNNTFVEQGTQCLKTEGTIPVKWVLDSSLIELSTVPPPLRESLMSKLEVTFPNKVNSDGTLTLDCANSYYGDDKTDLTHLFKDSSDNSKCDFNPQVRKQYNPYNPAVTPVPS